MLHTQGHNTTQHKYRYVLWWVCHFCNVVPNLPCFIGNSMEISKSNFSKKLYTVLGRYYFQLKQISQIWKKCWCCKHCWFFVHISSAKKEVFWGHSYSVGDGGRKERKQTIEKNPHASDSLRDVVVTNIQDVFFALRENQKPRSQPIAVSPTLTPNMFT